jgi:16S rRNA (guanine527-N7)-methyltransferase
MGIILDKPIARQAMMRVMAHKNKTNWSAFKARRSSSHIKKDLPLRGRHHKPETILSQAEAEDRLADILYNHDLKHITKIQISQLAKFYQILMTAQTHQNFTRLLKFRDIAIKHFIDSLIIRDLTQFQFPLLDIGTGPGFPGIVLKILFPDERILLAEGVQKRVDFLKKVRDELELKNLEIFGRNVTREFEYPVHGIITRAVEDMRNTLYNASHCLIIGGCAYFMKGPNVDPELTLVKKHLGPYYHLIQDTAYHLPKTSHYRRLIVYKKIGTPP